jgi:hypothetical protein
MDPRQSGAVAHAPRRRRIGRILAVIGIVLLVGLIVFRLALPTLVRDHVNRVLDRDPDYDGSIDEVDIALIRGAYVIHGVEIVDTKGEAPLPLFAAEKVDLSVKWKALLKGALVGEIDVLSPRINFVNVPKEAGTDQTGEDADWRDMVLDLFPLRIDRLAIADGEVHYQDLAASPKVDVEVTEIEVEANNLTNSEKVADTLMATIHGTGRPMDLGIAEVQVELDPFADLPTFDLNFAMRDVAMVKLNDLLKAYAKFDVEAGEMDAFVEVAARDGKFTGYVKPVLENVKVVKLEEEMKEDKDGPIQIVWETVVGGVKGVLNNEPHEQLATRIPIDGSFDDPKIGPWAAVVSALHNAFIEALSNSLDNDITFGDAPSGGGQSASADDGSRDKGKGDKRKKKKAKK